jgi:hypothetical protein
MLSSVMLSVAVLRFIMLVVIMLDVMTPYIMSKDFIVYRTYTVYMHILYSECIVHSVSF